MSESDLTEWYYLSPQNEEVGPVTLRQLYSLAGEGKIGRKTWVRAQDRTDWIPAEGIEHLLIESGRDIPAPPPLPASEPAPVKVEADPPERPWDLKPRMGSFVTPRVLVGLGVSVVLASASAVILMGLEEPVELALGVMVAGAVVAVWSSFVAYRKERYEIVDGRVVCYRGGLVNSETTELEARNITYVKLKLPWLRYKLFGVGTVTIQSAGSGRPVVMRVIREPEAVYEELRWVMQRQGYDLTRTDLRYEERPALIAVLGECLGAFFAVALTLLFSVPAFLDEQNGFEASFPVLVLQAALVITLLAVVGFVLMRILDYRRRAYRVYNDVVVYEEGFLTREHAFIPYENLADSNTKCTVLDRIFGLCDVHVSCQGSGSEIKFRHLRNGAHLSAEIDELVLRARQKPKSGREAGNTVARFSPRRREPELVPPGEAMVAELKMDAARTLVPLLALLPLFPLWIAAMVQSWIRIHSTRYSVRPGSLRHAYRFLTVHDREFAYDKITGLVIKRNLLDRMFGTMTLRFWSLGSGKPMEFTHVHAAKIELPALMRQVGIPAATTEPYDLRASFSVSAWLRARLNLLPVLLIFVATTVTAAVEFDPALSWLLALPVVLAAAGALYSGLYHSRQRLRFHEHHIEAEQGILINRCYYARYGNIKRTRVTRYPGGVEGNLEIFVAGEEEVQNANQPSKGQSWMRPCSFTSRFLPEVENQGRLLDDILCGRVEPGPGAVAAEPLEALRESSRSVGTAITRLVLLSVVLIPLVLLLPLTLPLVGLWTKRWRYRVEPTRIVKSWGVFYRSQTSILLDRVDSLQQSQGPLNKLFRNGNVLIMTAGSSRPDLKLPDSPDYAELHRMIRDHSA